MGRSTVLTKWASTGAFIGLHSPSPVTPSSVKTCTKIDRPKTIVALTSVTFIPPPRSGGGL